MPVAAAKESRCASAHSGEQRLLPVPPRCALAQELLLHRPGTGLAQPFAEPVDARDAAPAGCALEDDADVVLPRGRRLELLPGRHARPFAKEVDVAGVIHLIDQVRAAGAATDLAEDGLAPGSEEPLHVREAVAHPQGGENLAAELDARGEALLVHVAHGDDHRAHPLLRARLERLGQVGGDVLEGRLAVDADGIERELFALHVLFAARLRHTARRLQGRLQLRPGPDRVRIGAARPGDRLEDQRQSNCLGGFVHLALGAHAARPWHAKARGAHALLHQLLVAEAAHRIRAHAGQPPAVAHPGGQHHQHLPVGEDPIDTLATQPGSGARHHVVLVEDARHLQVIVQVRPHFGGQRRATRVADAEHLRAHLGKPARVLDHLGRKRRREEDRAHRGQLSTRSGLTESPRIAILPPPCLET